MQDISSPKAEIGKQTPAARREYRRFVEAGIRGKLASPLKDVVGEVLLGSAEWVERMRKKLASDDIDDNVPVQRRLAWRPSQQQIESAVAEEFGVDLCQLFAKRIRNNEARAAALFLIRRLTSVSATT